VKDVPKIRLAPRGGAELVSVPGGRFIMGSPEQEEGRSNNEGPQHAVELASFFMARTPVTNAQYRTYLEANRAVKEPAAWSDRKHNQPQQPVVGVSWDEAKAYCEWAGLRLPTEAQWEYACRAGSTTRYCSGDHEKDLAEVGWYDGNSGKRLHTVGELKPNAWGLYDMHGNVWELCEEIWVGDYQGVVHRPGDGLRTQDPGKTSTVVRGGRFGQEARVARSAYRTSYPPGGRGKTTGFRPVLMDVVDEPGGEPPRAHSTERSSDPSEAPAPEPSEGASERLVHELVDELARVFWDAEAARVLVQRAGFPTPYVPDFKTALGFWSVVISEARHGRIRGGAQAVVDEAVRQYPGNSIFTAYREPVRRGQ
jgi:formylglycine-generating enzyme required for sulfatase activity